MEKKRCGRQGWARSIIQPAKRKRPAEARALCDPFYIFLFPYIFFPSALQRPFHKFAFGLHPSVTRAAQPQTADIF